MATQGISALIKMLKIIRDLQEEDNQNRGQSQGLEDLINSQIREPARKTKRKVSSYHKKYSMEFKRLSPKFKKKNGSWKKDGFKRAAAAARKAAKK